ncbi:MAG: Shikimate dehydrogenase [Candidatus Roizmanbacteria bacterium GW2011_GWA2_37_7]|uniref:Shikimate dehydrogenase (NADP(+)) n=1 Tax=Candidatus Roizmanbacteria bacterium GW2011_GWA2_37_7 TaxID=1618481 RepID=A0A0G0JKR8_9BACT|nr:MAG: Shikimate dehydrogenase [Candidatus Roizmanbacteria bacterium GW2011_GWA2_37_7]
MNKINGKTKLIGFFGSTYKSSKMYKLYNTAFEALDLNYCYVPCAVDDLEKAFSGVLHLGFRAIGVSFPYKESIIPYLDELEPEAAAIGAVNVVTHQNGKLIGGMTDGLGAVCALEEVVKIDGSTVVVLGAGGAAKAIAYELSKHHCSLKILNRTIEKARDFAQKIDAQSNGYDILPQVVQQADILINATSVGMYPDAGACLVDESLMSSKITVMDIIGKPHETELLKRAKRAGSKVIYADRMLLHQAIVKFKYYTGVDAPIAVMEKVMQDMRE